MRVRIDDSDTWITLPDLTLAAVANGRYFGGGMKIAPGAEVGEYQPPDSVQLAAPYLLHLLPIMSI